MKSLYASLQGEEYRAAIGAQVISDMTVENYELESLLLEYLNSDQIVRRLPIGNAFVLDGLSVEQAAQISQLDRTVLLSLSKFRLLSDDVNIKKNDLKSVILESKTKTNIHSASDSQVVDTIFNEPVSDVKRWDPENFEKSSFTMNMIIPWNVKMINAESAWSRGIIGKDIIYGVIDTGVSYRHPAIRANYFGLKPDGTYDHNYAWYDGVRAEPTLTTKSSSYEEESEEDNAALERLERGLGVLKTKKKHSLKRQLKSKKSDEDEGYDADDESEVETDDESEVEAGNESGEETDVESEYVDDSNTRAQSFTKQNDALEPCPVRASEPCDSSGHGTHVLSSAVATHNLGMAPGSRWMACRSIAGKIGRDEDALACLNHFLRPHDLNGANPRPDLRPHVIGNSYGWGSWGEVIGSGIDLAVKRLEAAGTVMVFAAGNTGPHCGVVHSAFSLTVGATTEQNTLAHFSSRGPWTISRHRHHHYSHPNRRNIPLVIKPDISAPGKDIVGAYGSGHVAKMSGTSMAAPHVSGSIVLICTYINNNQPSFKKILFFVVQACPHLIGHPTEIQSLIQSTARVMLVPFGVNLCGNDQYQSSPNNFFGHGIIDIEKAIKACQK